MNRYKKLPMNEFVVRASRLALDVSKLKKKIAGLLVEVAKVC